MENNQLYHWGIKGMKWGVRRYQNEDGTLTEAGVKRYTRDYTGAAIGTPVAHDGQVYGLLQPHNAAHYPDTTPAMLAALWRVKHTTNPAKAKPWVKPTSTSDMYRAGECVIWAGETMRATRDTPYSPSEYAGDWERV